MSNLPKEQTKELIKEAAKKLFFVQGRLDATTQEIAEEAGVNRTLINYHFGSVDELLGVVLKEAKSVLKEKSHIIAAGDLSFKEKVALYIDLSLENSLKYPYLETFVVSRMNKNCVDKDSAGPYHKILPQFFKSVEAEMEKGSIPTMKPMQFFLNMISLLSFPNTIRPLLLENMGITTRELDELLAERKEIILNLLFSQH